jgi:hypothetical protein
MSVAGAVTMLFGVTTVVVGLWRHFETDGSPEALGFGAVMGTLALTGGVLLERGRRRAGLLLTFVALAFVSGWFVHRVLTGHSEGLSPRILTILTACAVEAVVFVRVALQRTPRGTGVMP